MLLFKNWTMHGLIYPSYCCIKPADTTNSFNYLFEFLPVDGGGYQTAI